MSTVPTLKSSMDKMPQVAVLRGISPSKSASVAQGLIDAGLTMIEVQLNSPDLKPSVDVISGLMNKQD